MYILLNDCWFNDIGKIQHIWWLFDGVWSKVEQTAGPNSTATNCRQASHFHVTRLKIRRHKHGDVMSGLLQLRTHVSNVPHKVVLKLMSVGNIRHRLHH